MVLLIWEVLFYQELFLVQNCQKDSKRTTIAISYCSMAFIQMVTMSSVLGFDKFFNLENFIYWASSPLMFILVQ